MPHFRDGTTQPNGNSNNEMAAVAGAGEETEKYDYRVKLLMVGDMRVGKTSLLVKYFDNTFVFNTISTIGVDFRHKTLEYNGKMYYVQAFDTAGQERYRTITKAYYRNAHGIVIVFSVDNRTSFNNVKKWIADLRQKSEPDVVLILVGNKIDIARKVTYEEGKEMADSFNIRYYESSAKDSTGVAELFEHIISEAQKYVTAKPPPPEETDSNISPIINLSQPDPSNSQDSHRRRFIGFKCSIL